MLTRAKSRARRNDQPVGEAARLPVLSENELPPVVSRFEATWVSPCAQIVAANRVAIFWRVRQILGRASATHFVTCTRSRSARAFAQAARWSQAYNERGLAIFPRARSASAGPLSFATDTLIPPGRRTPSLRNYDVDLIFSRAPFRPSSAPFFERDQRRISRIGRCRW